MKVGYYYANSAQYGKHYPEIKNQVDIYMDWEDTNSQTRKVPPGKDLYICLGLNYYTDHPPAEVVRSAIKSLRPVWKRIKNLELADEPEWNANEVKAMMEVVKQECKAAGLPCPPLGCTFTTNAVLKGVAWKPLDWVGVEAYITYKPGEPARKAAGRVEQVIKDQLRRVGNKPVVIVCQAYDRNGTWKDMSSLLAVNEATWRMAEKTPTCRALTLFSYARPGGSRDHKELRVLHDKLYNA